MIVLFKPKKRKSDLKKSGRTQLRCEKLPDIREPFQGSDSPLVFCGELKKQGIRGPSYNPQRPVTPSHKKRNLMVFFFMFREEPKSQTSRGAGMNPLGARKNGSASHPGRGSDFYRGLRKLRCERCILNLSKKCGCGPKLTRGKPQVLEHASLPGFHFGIPVF